MGRHQLTALKGGNMENTDRLLKQIPQTILADIDAAEDRQIIASYRDARERGEDVNRDDPEYLAALRRCARTLRERLKNAPSVPVPINDIVARLDAGRLRLANHRPSREAGTPARESRPEQRTVAPTPLDWSTLTDEELERLLEEDLRRELSEVATSDADLERRVKEARLNLSRLSDQELERMLEEERRKNGTVQQ
jgi:hypothetical protein